MKKPDREMGATPSLAAPVDDLIELFPLFADQMASTCYDGDPPGTRATSTLLAFCDAGCWKVCLRDRQEQRCLWVAASSYLDLVSVLEAALADPVAVWRDDRASGAETAKRRKL